VGVSKEYQKTFEKKIFNYHNPDHDLLMDVFNLTSELKGENPQYWGTQLGRCWEKLIIEICKTHCQDFKPAFKIKIKNEEHAPFDLIIDNYAIDTKYRIGSGDSGKHYKLQVYGNELKKMGYTPVMLIFREDNLQGAITACKKGNWTIYTGDDTFKFIQQISDFDLKQFLMSIKAKFAVVR